MKPQRQKFRHDPTLKIWGDCHRTCIAIILNMDRDNVPHFMEGRSPEALQDAESQDSKEVEKAIDDFLAIYNLAECLVPMDGNLPLEKILECAKNWFKAPVILGGLSTTGVDHSVVVYKGEIYNPNWCDLIGPCKNGSWWFNIISVGENWR